MQKQQKIAWPSQLVVAKAYLNQLARSQALSAKQIEDLNKAVVHAEKSHFDQKSLAKLNQMASSIDSSATSAKNPADANRLHLLSEILKHPTA